MMAFQRAALSHEPLLGIVIKFPTQLQFPARQHPIHRSSVLAPNSVSQNLTDDDFARGLSLNDDDDKMNQLYDAAQMEDPDFFGCGLNGYDGEEIEGVGDETVPRLNSIFDHPLITKICIEENGRLVSAWKCGFCTPDHQGIVNNIFKGLPNATKALKHVTRTPGGKIRPCNGNIPPESMRQFQRLKLERESLKDERETSKMIVSNTIEDNQHRVLESMANSGGQRQEVLVFFLL